MEVVVGIKWIQEVAIDWLLVPNWKVVDFKAEITNGEQTFWRENLPNMNGCGKGHQHVSTTVEIIRKLLIFQKAMRSGATRGQNLLKGAMRKTNKTNSCLGEKPRHNLFRKFPAVWRRSLSSMMEVYSLLARTQACWTLPQTKETTTILHQNSNSFMELNLWKFDLKVDFPNFPTSYNSLNMGELYVCELPCTKQTKNCPKRQFASISMFQTYTLVNI